MVALTNQQELKLHRINDSEEFIEMVQESVERIQRKINEEHYNDSPSKTQRELDQLARQTKQLSPAAKTHLVEQIYYSIYQEEVIPIQDPSNRSSRVDAVAQAMSLSKIILNSLMDIQPVRPRAKARDLLVSELGMLAMFFRLHTSRSKSSATMQLANFLLDATSLSNILNSDRIVRDVTNFIEEFNQIEIRNHPSE